jgi:hypothetical protein
MEIEPRSPFWFEPSRLRWLYSAAATTRRQLARFGRDYARPRGKRETENKSLTPCGSENWGWPESLKRTIHCRGIWSDF